MHRPLARSVLLILSAAAIGCGVPASKGNGKADGDGVRQADALIPTVTWQKMGTPGLAVRIAACAQGDGRVYALNGDRSIWVSYTGGTDGSWKYLITDTYVQQIFCATNQLYVMNDDRTVWANTGTDDHITFSQVGKPGDAKDITAATSWAVILPYPVVYALNDDDSFWRSTSASDGSWTNVGTLYGTNRIAAGGGSLEARPFAINYDGSLWLNSGDGCDQYWTRITDPGVWQQIGTQLRQLPLPIKNAEISAADLYTIYVLLTDHTLWKGTIHNSESMTSVRQDGKPQHCNGTVLVTNHCGDYNENCCPGNSCNGDSTMGLICDGANLCAACGGDGEPPCANDTCKPGIQLAPTKDGSKVCAACGNANQPCCHYDAGGWNYCVDGQSCFDGSGTNWTNGVCLPSASAGQGPTCPAKDTDYSPCCKGNCIGNRFCNSDNKCQPAFGGPTHGNSDCVVWVRAHATTCTNNDGTPSSLSNTSCGDGCGPDFNVAKLKALASLASHTPLGDAHGSCQYVVDQNANYCGGTD